MPGGTDKTRRMAVQRDDDILTKEEEYKFKVEIGAAMLLELQTWTKFGRSSRKLCTAARNVIDSLIPISTSD